jgi:hypothetical protein
MSRKNIILALKIKKNVKRNIVFLFQVVMEGVWGNNRVSGFIGIDDVTFFQGDCDSKTFCFI